MNEHSNSHNKTSGRETAPFRPDLSHSMYAGNDEERILASLKPSTKPAKQALAGSKSSYFKKLFIAFAGIAAVLIGYQFLVRSSQVPSDKLRTIEARVAVPNTSLQGEANASPSLLTATVVAPKLVEPSPVATTTQAAQIVDESPSPRAGSTGSASTVVSALEDGVKPTEAVIEKALGIRSEAGTKTAETSNRNTTAPHDPSVAKVKAATPNQAAKSKDSNEFEAKAAAVAATSAKKKSTSNSDKDINLIEALLAHNSSAIKPGTRLTNTGTDLKPVSTSAGKPIATAVSAESGGQSTDTALRQCAQLEAADREACKLKVCDTTGSIDPACQAIRSTQN